MSILLAALTSERSNDASVAKYTLPAPYIPGPYAHTSSPATLPYVPSLSWFALNKLAQVGADQVSALIDLRRNYQRPASDEAFDLLRALIPSLALAEFDWAPVDPRLWATTVQVYDCLPPIFQSYPIPLSDIHLPMLQRIQCTPQFTLVTILELPGCRELSDMTIVNLKHLHSLAAFDASSTSLSSHGLKILAGTVLRSDEDQTRKGPWGLRILRLRHCRNVDDRISPHLAEFRLLSILDLRGTQCHSTTFIPSFEPAATPRQKLYHPTPLQHSLDLLLSICELFSSPNVFTLYINTLHHPATAERPPVRQTPTEDVCVTFTSSGSTQFVVPSSTDAPKPYRRRRRSGQERKPELDDFNDIAERELFAHNTRQNIMSFYHSAPKPHPRHSVRGYDYPPEAPLPPSAKEALLMLYRSPPPWALLDAALAPHAPVVKPVGALEVVTGVSKRKRAEMAQYTEQLNENLKRRKIQQTAQSAVGGPESAPLSRNPFRRKASKEETNSSSAPSSSAPRPLHPLLAKTRGTDPAVPSPSPSPITQKRVTGNAPGERNLAPDRDKVARKSAFSWGTWGKK
ncbi:hypothetical protein C8F04DRAFT_1061697 [Mycena alexandri]|uniref:Uncharacterized protein n=1 Tax=Mycena alexandri TaxID=1745969 RepID=A0AAD6TJK4_9AGAR|nr:hypothetical protein C8F04DRAFT_1061697 [Mycena alexandri]